VNLFFKFWFFSWMFSMFFLFLFLSFFHVKAISVMHCNKNKTKKLTLQSKIWINFIFPGDSKEQHSNLNFKCELESREKKCCIISLRFIIVLYPLYFWFLKKERNSFINNASGLWLRNNISARLNDLIHQNNYHSFSIFPSQKSHLMFFLSIKMIVHTCTLENNPSTIVIIAIILKFLRYVWTYKLRKLPS
jgi:hypothetical protein